MIEARRRPRKAVDRLVGSYRDNRLADAHGGAAT